MGLTAACGDLFSNRGTRLENLVSLGYPETVAKRILKHRPWWYEKIKEYHTTPESAQEGIVWYRGLDVDDVHSYDPKSNSDTYMNELWVARDLQDASKHGKFIIELVILPYQWINHSRQGLAIDRRLFKDDRVTLLRIGIRKPEAQRRHYMEVRESDFDWMTYEELVASGQLAPL